MNCLLHILVSWAIFFGVDMVWIRVIMGSFYRQHMQSFFRFVMNTEHQVFGMGVWLLLVLGIKYLVLPQVSTLKGAVMLGAFFGAVVYGVYDLTNFVVINNWSYTLTFVDWAWGIFVNGMMAGLMFWLDKKF